MTIKIPLYSIVPPTAMQPPPALIVSSTALMTRRRRDLLLHRQGGRLGKPHLLCLRQRKTCTGVARSSVPRKVFLKVVYIIYKKSMAL